MKITLGNIIWIISFILFLFMSYGMNTFGRLLYIFSDKEFVILKSQEEKLSLDELNISDNLRIGSENVHGGSRNMPSTSTVPSIRLEIEKLEWEINDLRKDFEVFKIIIENEKEKSNRIFDDLLAILTTLSPLLVPVITARFLNHKRQIRSKKMET